MGDKDDNGSHGPEDQRGVRRVPEAPAAARSDVLLGDAPAAGRGAPGHARAVRVRPHRRPDRRRAGPPADPGGAAGGARRVGGGAARRALLAPGGDRPDGRRRAARPAARRARRLHDLDARRLRAGPDRQRRRARRLHGRVGRLGRPDHGPAARRAGALPRRLRPARPGLPARELHPRRRRGLGDGPHLPAGAGRRGPGDRPRDAAAARRRRPAGRARQGAVRRRRAGRRGRSGVGAERDPARVRRLRPHPRPRRGGRAATCSTGGSECGCGTSCW